MIEIARKYHLGLSLILILFACNIASQPRVSIITSVYKGNRFIEGFMADIVRQTIFDDCELIIINANSPEDEEPVIQRYCAHYPNIRYLRLDYDPGLYGVWNMAIQMSRAQYITNANIDDRLKTNCYAKHAKALDKNPHIDLVYSDFYLTTYPNETFENNNYSILRTMPEFSKANMVGCLPNNHPMWRKSMHTKYGYFNTNYRFAGDYEMWMRAVAGGAEFLKVHGIYGLYYANPTGLSTNPQFEPIIMQEAQTIYNTYGHIFNKGLTLDFIEKFKYSIKTHYSHKSR